MGHPTPEGDISHESGVTYRTVSHAGDATHTEYRSAGDGTHTEYRMRVTERTLNHRISQCG